MNEHIEQDVIAQLRSERPEPTSDPALDVTTMPRPFTRNADDLRMRRRRTGMRVALVAAVAAAAVLTGVQFLDSDTTRTRPALGISTADAKALAVTALRGVSKLTDYHMVQSWTITETGGERRVVQTRTDATVTDGNRASFNHNRNDFVDLDVTGAEFRTVGGRTYVEAGTPRIEQRWVTALKPGGGSIMGYSFPAPQTEGIIEQLQREELITARRTTSGAVVVEVRRPASELADVDGMSTRMGDPITNFATGFARSEDPDTEITARLTISNDGALRGIRISTVSRTTVPDGHGGAEIEAETVSETKLSPPKRTVRAPDPQDVMVVGDILRTRKGATGTDGPHATLDTYTPAQLRALTARVRGTYDSTGVRVKRPARPARDYTALMRQIARKRQAMRAELATMERDPAALAANERCTPFWPDSGRAMDTAKAQADPASAGWRCHLRTVDAYVSSEPDGRGWMWEFIGGGGGGCCITDRDIARARG